MYRTPVLATVLVLLACGSLEAQDWKSVTSFRQRSDEATMDVHVRYGAGRLLIRPAEGSSELYRVGLRYDADVFDPITEYRAGRLEVGVEGTGQSIRLRNHDAGELDLRLSPDVPLDLDLEFGAVEAELDLGGLRISALGLETGASDTRLSFSRPNPVRCERLSLSVGAASFRADGLGNLDCRSVDVEGGVGDITLDFGGEWKGDVDASIDMALGSVTLHLPSDVGLRVERETFLMPVEGSRLEKRDDAHVSTNWDTARYRMTVDLSGAFGSFNVVWR